MVGILSCWAKGFFQSLPLIVLHSVFLEVPPPLFTNGYFMPFDSLLYHWVLKKDMSVLHSLCFFGTSFEPSTLAMLCVLGISTLWQLLRDPGLALSVGFAVIP